MGWMFRSSGVLGRVAATAGAAILGAAIMASPARADESSQNFNAQNWKPALDPYGYAAVEGAQSLSLLSLHFQTYYDWTNQPLRLIEPRTPGGDDREIIEKQFMMNICFAIGVLPDLLGQGSGLTIGVDLPIALYEDGREVDGDPPGTQPDHLNVTGWGDLRIAAKLTIFGRDDAALGFAVQASLELPTGDEEMFVSNGHDKAVPYLGVILEKRIPIFRIAANLGYEIQPLELGIPGVQVDDKIKMSAAFAIEPFEPLGIPILKNCGIFAEVLHWTRAEDPWKNEYESPAEAGLGVRFQGVILDILAGFNTRLNDGVGAPDERFYVSLSFIF